MLTQSFSTESTIHYCVCLSLAYLVNLVIILSDIPYLKSTGCSAAADVTARKLPVHEKTGHERGVSKSIGFPQDRNTDL